jgi:hypothetical protein
MVEEPVAYWPRAFRVQLAVGWLDTLERFEEFDFFALEGSVQPAKSVQRL